MPAVLSRDAPIFEIPGVTFTGLTSPSRGSQENSVWRFVVQPGTPGKAHRVTREETFVALHGCALLQVDGVSHMLPAGSAFAVPADSLLLLSNPGTEPFHAMAVLPVGGQVVTEDAATFTPPWAV